MSGRQVFVGWSFVMLLNAAALFTGDSAFVAGAMVGVIVMATRQ